MENNSTKVLHMADGPVNEMFHQDIENSKQQAEIIHISSAGRSVGKTAKFSEKHSEMQHKKKVKEQMQNRFNAAGIIHRQHHYLEVPLKLNVAAAFWNIELALYIEGVLQGQLWKIQKRKWKKFL